MAFCIIQDIRDQSDKLSNVVDVPDTKITPAITHAERVVKVDLGSILTPDEMDEVGGDSNVIKTLAIYKATEMALATLYGATRKVDEVSDIQYWQKLYNGLLKQIKDGEIPLDIPTGKEASQAKDYPATSSGNKKFYIRKGVTGFYPDGGVDSYVDDRIK